MAINGSDLLADPWNTSTSAWTDLFEQVTGNGQVFWLFILIILTFGIWTKSEGHALYTGMFMISFGTFLKFCELYT